MSLMFPEVIEQFSHAFLGTVEETITPTKPGRVAFRASYWPAQFISGNYQVTVAPGEEVRVVGRKGITLLVVPADDSFDRLDLNLKQKSPKQVKQPSKR